MGNIFGKPRAFYTASVYDTSPDYNSGDYEYDGDLDYDFELDYYYTSYYDSYLPFDWSQFLLCCPWYPSPLDEEYDEDSYWDGAIYGVVRRKACKDRDHWALAIRHDIDVSQLPRRIDGYRTRIPSRCERKCGNRQRFCASGDKSSKGQICLTWDDAE
ncbi:hypothetical protein F4677DRAFT_465232 [Hypoxylon crocopeplum]|nr:hypothetical protein F4677DRAFT_465232 [Hypoxylon crocopeplum]